MKLVFLLLARKCTEEKGGMCGRERTCVAISGKIGGGLRWFIYTAVFTASWFS